MATRRRADHPRQTRIESTMFQFELQFQVEHKSKDKDQGLGLGALHVGLGI